MSVVDRYISSLTKTFAEHSNSENAVSMQKYMKNKFKFFGIKSTLRRELSKDFLKKEDLPDFENIGVIVRELWSLPQRELQYFAMELLFKYSKVLQEDDYKLFEFMIINKSWWDTVDFIAAKIVGSHFLMYPTLRGAISKKWINADDIWLNRTGILFQLKYKGKTNEEMLYSYILQHSNSSEFFIRKAIGWSLREYSKTDSESVTKFVQINENQLSSLSIREALKHIKKDNN